MSFSIRTSCRSQGKIAWKAWNQIPPHLRKGLKFHPRILGSLPETDFCISEARKAVSEGQIKEGLSFLNGVVDSFITEGNLENARPCLVEAQRIFEEADDAELFHEGLRIAAHNFTIGRKTEAELLFLRVLGYVDKEGSLYKRDAIRFAAAMTYMRIGLIEDSIKIARDVQELTSRFSLLLNMAEAFLELGDFPSAKECLLIDCAQTARMQSDRLSKIPQLIRVAKMFIEIGENMEAKKILDEVAPRLSNQRAKDCKNLEKVALILVKLGKKQDAIELLTRGWINQKAFSPDEITAGELERSKLQLIARRFPDVYAVISEE